MLPLLSILWFLNFSQAISQRDKITPIQPLAYNETLVSADGRFALGFFTPGKSKNHYIGLWYNKISDKTPVWVANRNNPVTSSTGLVSISSSSGELLIKDQNSTVVWSSGIVTNMTNPVAQLLNSGNLVIKDANSSDDKFAWQGFDYPTDTLLEGMKMGVDFVTGLNRTLTAWTSESDPSSSQYYAMLDIHGDPQLVLCSGSKKVYRAGPWNGLRYSGNPATLTYDGFNFSFINNKKEISYYFTTIPSVLSKLSVNQSGELQRSLWVEGTGFWNKIWYAPMDQCDHMPPYCGPFATCNPDNSPICDCIQQGFKPKSPDQWKYRDAANGCVRKTGLDCKNGTDLFLPIPNLKLADTSNATVDTSLSLGECKVKCLSNCACTAYALADVRNGGSGCIIWMNELTDLKVLTNDTDGQDLYVRLAAADLGQSPTTTRKSKKWIYILVIILIFFMLILAYVGSLLWRRKRRRMRAVEEINTPFHDRSNQGIVSGNDLELSRGSDLELPLLDLKTVAFATDNFSVANKLGEGGFGPVFKGKLGNGQEIAVKRLAKTSVQGMVEFKNEVLLIAKLQHRNLVRLLSCCIEGEERILIYEYMPNKSLDYFLFEKSKDQVLDWQTRFKIIMGIARGILYLHQDSRLRIIHRDLKASNILLDEAMNPKISDFGMARIFCADEAVGNTMKVVGTFGYMSPEYAMDGIFSQKSDVFSFGVLVLELITGKKNRGVYLAAPHTNLLDHVWALWKEGISMQLVDESMGCCYSMNEVMRCIKVGLLCVQNHPEDRPFMSSVLLMLSGDNTLLPNPKEPGFAMRSGVTYQMESSSSKTNPSSSYDMSVTLMEAR